MGIVDFILNLAALLLWFNWRAVRFDPLNRRTPATLMGTLRPAAPQKFRRWHLPVVIAGLLFLRALFYWQLGSAANWTAKLDLGVIMISFRSDWFWRTVLFSYLSFVLTLLVFYLWLLLLSILSGPEPIQRLIRMQLGRVDAWPRKVKCILPAVVIILLWLPAGALFAWLRLTPPPISVAHRLEQAAIIALGGYLTWKFIIAALLALHLLNNYIYFGRHPFWGYVDALAQRILWPLKRVPLRVGKINFAPVLGIALVFALAQGAAVGLGLLYQKLPF